MKCQQIREKAEVLGLDSTRLNKKELIHAIQIAEGNFPCFLTARNFCDQINCCWRDECLFPHKFDQIHLEEIKAALHDLLLTVAGEKKSHHVASNNASIELKFQQNTEELRKDITKTLYKLSIMDYLRAF